MNTFQHFLKKYHMEKWFQKENLIVLVLTGILLAVIAIPVEKSEEALPRYEMTGLGTRAQDMVTESSADVYMGEQGMTGDNMYHTELERRLIGILSEIEGAGEVHAMITVQESETLMSGSKVEGVVVVAQGANNGRVKQHITEAVQALFDIEMHKIKVIGS